MGILFLHTEDKKYHVYRTRSRGLWYSYRIAIFLLAVTAGIAAEFRMYSVSAALAVPFALLAAAGLADIYSVRKAGKNAVLQNRKHEREGDIFMGTYSLRIRK